MSELNVQVLKHKLALFAEQGRLDSSLLDSLIVESGFAPVECEVLDYKESIALDRLGLASITQDIAALHNTYGGYLIFGVSEVVPDVVFRAVGISPDLIDVEQLRSLSTSYLGTRIALTLKHFTVEDENGAGVSISVLHVPKRSHADPAHFTKDGPGGKNNKPVFAADDIYFRRTDETLRAAGKDYRFLFGERPNPFGTCSDNPLLASTAEKKLLDHNLPDRAFICPDFVGRKVELERLWEWFADDFSHVRILAGEGGLGKTSIAYQFAGEVCSEPALGLEQIIWFTAKKRQFLAIRNEYVDVPETHFETYDDLLRALCRAVAITEEELCAASEKGLKHHLQEGAKSFPSLFIVDDVDSLPQQDQRKALELGFLFNGTKTRLLATTRVNQSYSNDIAIPIGGFSFQEYSAYVETVRHRYSLPQLTASEIQRMHGITNGSPMYTESLYRLVRFTSASDAFKKWKSDQGEMARGAALSREIEQLSPESKRVLLVAAYLKEASVSELCHITGYVDTAIVERLNELQALHLLAAPQVTAEARFRLSSTTEEFVVRRADLLATDYSKLEQRTIALRQEAKQVKTVRNNRLVGAAIDQAMGQLKRSDVSGAIETIIAAEKEYPNHPDLLCMLARCYMKLLPPEFDTARRLARRAFQGGSRKEILFEVWYRAEDAARHSVGAAEVAALAIEADAAPAALWKERSAASHWEIAKAQASSGNLDKAIEEYWLADKEIRELMKHAPKGPGVVLRQSSDQIHDEIWRLATNVSGSRLIAATAGLDVLRAMMASGDTRQVLYSRVKDLVGWMADELQKDRWPISSKQRELVDLRMGEANELMKKGCYSSAGKIDDSMASVARTIEVQLQRLQDVLDKRGISEAVL